MKALLDLFKKKKDLMPLKSVWHHLKEYVHGHMVKLKSQKRLITELLNQSAKVYSVPRFLGQLKTTSAYVANTNA